MPATFDPLDASPRATLATAALPRRVRRLLEQLYALVSDEIAPQMERMLAEFEQQLFRQADQARNPGLQSGYLETLRLVRLRRSDLIPRYLVGLEAELSRVREAAAEGTSRPAASAAPEFRELRLVEDSEIDEATVLRSLASRHESRAGLGLLLLGQRFGVLAGAPAFDSERLPVGPHRLIRRFAQACQPLQIPLESRLDLYRVFDQQVMLGYSALVESMNLLLARDNVLPSLSFVPLRARPSAQDKPAPAPRAEADPAAETAREPGAAPAPAAGPRPHTAWTAAAAAPAADALDFATLQRWLSERRDLVEKLRPRPPQADAPPAPPALATGELIELIAGLDEAAGRGAQPLRKIADLRQALLAQRRAAGAEAALSREDGDVFELLGLLFDEIDQRLRGDAVISNLLNRLQTPLLHAALRDRSLLAADGHPALQLLNTVAEAGARWTPAEEADPQLHEPLRQAVEHVVEQRGSAQAFDSANQRLQEHLHALARKAEVAERRHVEAARGKEKLELAKRRAQQALSDLVEQGTGAGQRLPRFVQTLLSQAWTDVLTLTQLRHGEDSDAWQRQLQITGQIVAANQGGGGARLHGLDGDIEHALTLVGYHGDDARAIARQLTVGPATGEDAASRTELAMKLRQRSRLGEDGAAAAATAPRAPLPPRDEREQACFERLRALPFGTWFEFVQNQQGDAVRRRLSWFSPVTDNALFVNHRGQRVAEHSLDALARMLARGQARIVEQERNRLVDRAWHAALDALRGFGGRGRDEPPERPA
ncbi:DUF1631 family protein [Lysobacter enzymogenes]|uniref:DUF1631 family protein n=1 Tax=Lysobacter enzymogenes TaxID=69 RepID=UPI001AF57162|nr:DUF1631 family protein [Lysobacter enzymogenes]QQQ00372.1 DUF1631 domain-containing protein [Lysobacter enzymogenes]